MNNEGPNPWVDALLIIMAIIIVVVAAAVFQQQGIDWRIR